MQNKKLALLLSKLPEDKKAAFIDDVKTAAPDTYGVIIAKYGIALTGDEKAFLASKPNKALSDEELKSISGGETQCSMCGITCASCTCSCCE